MHRWLFRIQILCSKCALLMTLCSVIINIVLQTKLTLMECHTPCKMTAIKKRPRKIKYKRKD